MILSYTVMFDSCILDTSMYRLSTKSSSQIKSISGAQTWQNFKLVAGSILLHEYSSKALHCQMDGECGVWVARPEYYKFSLYLDTSLYTHILLTGIVKTFINSEVVEWGNIVTPGDPSWPSSEFDTLLHLPVYTVHHLPVIESPFDTLHHHPKIESPSSEAIHGLMFWCMVCWKHVLLCDSVKQQFETFQLVVGY